MDTYMRTLSLSSKTLLEEIVLPCFKILRWLTFDAQVELNYIDIETAIKATLYLKECFALFGVAKLRAALVDQNPFHQPFLEHRVDQLVKGGCLSIIIAEILKSKNGYKHVFVVEKLKMCIKDKFKVPIDDDKAPDAEKIDDISKTRQRLHVIMQRLFRVPKQNIEMIIKHAIDTFPFVVLGYTFLEPAGSEYLDRCTIVEQIICDELERFCISPKFLRSIYVAASLSDSGQQLYWQCLGNEAFSRSLFIFMIDYFKTTASGNLCPKAKDAYRKYGFIDMIYLVYSALLPQSPCADEMRKRLGEANLPNLLEILNTSVLVFD